jgi:hypothetical protein
MGPLISNPASGNWSVSKPWVCIWPSRKDSSLCSVVMSTANEAEVTDEPSISTVPVTSGVRPTAVLAPMPPSSSRTR